MNTIYLVFARWDYEGDSAIKAFQDEAEAEAFATKCSEHHERMPRTTPPIEDSVENNAAWDEWQAEKTAWDKAHPAGESNTTADSFIVIGVPFFAKEPSCMTTHLDIEKERAEFDAWADSKGLPPHARGARWDGWYAARSASLPPTERESMERAADYLEQYAKYIREDVRSEDIERHPYIPSIEQAASELRAMIADASTDAASRCRAQGGITQPETAARASLQADEGKDAALDLARRALETSYSKDVARDVERRNAIKAIAAIAAKEGKQP